MVFLVSACQPGDALPAGGHVSAIRQTEGRSFSDFSSADLRPRWGRSAGPHFSPMRNGGKNRLGRSPLSTPLGVPGWACVKLVFGPFPLLWSLFVPPHQATMAAGPIAGWFSPPGLPWRSGVPAAGSQASGNWEQLHTWVRPWYEKHSVSKKQALSVEFSRHLCDPTGPRAEIGGRIRLSVPRGGFHKAGEGPAFGGSLVTFCPFRKSPQRSASPLARGTKLRLRNRRSIVLQTSNKKEFSPCFLVKSCR